jgi:glycosyltransferase involved in cell wall biosynthesis
MIQGRITPQNTEFVILCFEGPDQYSMAGGLGVRIANLSATLAKIGFQTHLFFIGDPALDSVELRQNGKLVLHRMCQWISKYHPNGVYEAEEAKLYDYNESIPRIVKDDVVKPAVAKGKVVVVLSEEWHTAEALCRLSDYLYSDGLRDKVIMYWNANNLFSFHRINWGRLGYVSTLTTISRYMKHLMWRMGMNPLVIPNGIPRELLRKVDEGLSRDLRTALGAELVLCKVARWDPDKRWNVAVETAARLKERGIRTILLARGGMEPYGQEVLNNARSLGLVISEAVTDDNSFEGYLKALHKASYADVIDIRFHVPIDFLRIMYHACDAVLANSGHEPFGIVGLEAMAAGGIAFTGCTGEDYAIPFVNAFVLETPDPMEAVGYLMYLRDYPEEGIRIREAARRTARYFTWEAAVINLIHKLENQARIKGVLGGVPTPLEPQFAMSKLPPELVATAMKRNYNK